MSPLLPLPSSPPAPSVRFRARPWALPSRPVLRAREGVFSRDRLAGARALRPISEILVAALMLTACEADQISARAVLEEQAFTRSPSRWRRWSAGRARGVSRSRCASGPCARTAPSWRACSARPMNPLGMLGCSRIRRRARTDGRPLYARAPRALAGRAAAALASCRPCRRMSARRCAPSPSMVPARPRSWGCSAARAPSYGVSARG